MRDLTFDEQKLLDAIAQLNDKIHSSLCRVDELTDMLVGPLDKLTVVEDVDFWIAKLPPGFYRTELRVLKATKMQTV